MIYPTLRLIQLTATLLPTALVASLWPMLSTLWIIHAIVIALVVMFDALGVYWKQNLQVERKLPGYLSLGVASEVILTLHNHGSLTRTLEIFDHIAQSFSHENLPQPCTLASEQHAQLTYNLTPTERGKFTFPLVQVLIQSPFNLWKRSVKLPCESTTYVYPNFSAVSHLALLATDNKLSQLGIVKKQRRGEGQDFHQLREYREGDNLRQIDWKATSRLHKLISREYQDERDQEIIFLLDCGHRMLTKDDELSHFDHTLNAILLLSYVALRQGDAVGLATFNGFDRWLRPSKGHHVIQSILNQVYDLQPTHQAPDYSSAITQLMTRQKKRALVILVSNLRDEDQDDLSASLRILGKHHLVVLANLREQALEQALEQDIKHLTDALTHASVHHYLNSRKHTFDRINTGKMPILDVIPQELSVNLINTYLGIKSSGAL